MKSRLKKQVQLHFSDLFSSGTAVIWLFCVLVLVIAGPFGTLDRLDFAHRAIFWIVVVSLSMLSGYLVRAVSYALVPRERRLLQEALITLLLLLVLTPVIWLVTRMMAPPDVERLPGFGMLGLYVFVITAAVTAIRHLVPELRSGTQRFIDANDGDMPHGPNAPEPRLGRRLSDSVRGPILRLSAQDHHVEVATVHGSELLRMRLVDAIGQMPPVEGYCTHRSHWVSRAAIVEVDRETAQKTWIVLSNGDRVPVSRKYRPELEEAGIL